MNSQTSQASRFSKWHIEPQREEEQEAWLITYLDMLTLLLQALDALQRAGLPCAVFPRRCAASWPTVTSRCSTSPRAPPVRP